MLGAGSLKSLVDGPLPGIVCSRDQVPLAKILVQIFQMGCGCVCRFNGIAPFIDPRVDPPTVLAGGGGDQLPKSDGSLRARAVGRQTALIARAMPDSSQ